MVKIETKAKGSLFHYAHFICDCLFPEINLKLYEKGEVVRKKNLKQSIGNFSKIYEEVMGIKNTEVSEKIFLAMDGNPIIVKRGKKTPKSEFAFFRKYMFNKFKIVDDPSYPEILLIERGERVELLSDPDLKKVNKNFTTGKERREIEKIDELKTLLEKEFPTKSKTLILEKIPFVEQIKYFYNARLVIAIHGAALSNLLFSKPNTTVVEVLGDRTFNFFDTITGRLGINHIKVENNIDLIKKKITILLNMKSMNTEDIFDYLTIEVQRKKLEVSRNRSKIPVPSIFYVGMEKAGSKSLLFGFSNHNVAHWHCTNYFEEKYETKLLSDKKLDLYDFAIYLGKKHKFKPLIVECIREPISQIISAATQHLKKYNKKICKCEYCKYADDNQKLLELVKKNINVNNWIHYKNRGFQSISMWKKHFNIDLLKVFQRDNCYYDLPDAKILLIRLEDVEKREKLFEKIGYIYKETFANKTEEHEKVADIYKYLYDNLNFTDDELDKIYSNEVKIFYKPLEIEQFKEKWRKKSAIPTNAILID